MTDVLVAFLPAPVAMRLFSHSPSVARQMLRHLAQKIQRDSSSAPCSASTTRPSASTPSWC
jgi:CRP-like cAMP-binding protein